MTASATSVSPAPHDTTETRLARRSVVFSFSSVTWDGSASRGMNFCQDRLLQGLLRDEDIDLLVANPYRSAPLRVARRLLGREVPFPSSDRASLWGPQRLRRRDPASIRALERTYRSYGRALERAVANRGFDQPALITFNPLVAGMAELDWAGPITLYATDDLSAHHGYARWSQAYQEAYARVRDAGYAVCAVSEEIIHRIAPKGQNLVVPNGIDPGEWLDIQGPPRWFEDLPQPRILYVGTLDSRIDVGMVADTAHAVRDGSVALVGRLADPDHLSPLRSMSNVFIRPSVPRAEVPGLVRAADACIVPHERTPLTKAMSPLKVYEYVAAGRPVASVDLPPIRRVHDSIVLVPKGASFADGVWAALRRGPLTEHERNSFLEQNSWQRRHEQVLSLALRD